jgi:alkylation response protein AidB-like acyl-CoA dehydrogenase
MEFDWSPEEAQLRATVRQIVLDHAPPGWTSRSRDVFTPELLAASKQVCRALAEAGVWIPHWPAEYGGRDASVWEQLIVGEELWGAGEPRGPQYMNTNWIAPAIIAAGTDAQKERYLPRIAAGDVLWCQGFSEPDAGSDLASLRTSAVRDGDTYVVNGQKIWTSYAHVAEYCFLLVRTDAGANKRDGISILLVPMELPGIEVREVPSIIGPHAVHEIFFADVRVPVDCRLGEENDGWPLIRKVLAHERVGAARFERASRVLDEAMRSLPDGPVDEVAAGRAFATCEAARALAYAAVQDRGAGRDRSATANATRVGNVAAERAVARVLSDEAGQQALVAGNPADEQLTVSLPVSISSGTLEVQLDLVARLGLDLPRG